MPFQKGHPCYVSKEAYAKAAAKRIGRVVSEETRRKIILAQKGIPRPYTRYNRSTETIQRMSEAQKKRWQDPEQRSKMLLQLQRANQIKIAKGQSQEEREKRASKIRGIKRTEETKAKMRLARSKWSMPTEDTCLERAVCRWLSSNGVFFTRHAPIEFEKERYHKCDIFVWPNVIIECDGTYWHSRPSQREFDKYFDRKASELGYTVLRLPEPMIREALM